MGQKFVVPCCQGNHWFSRLTGQARGWVQEVCARTFQTWLKDCGLELPRKFKAPSPLRFASAVQKPDSPWRRSIFNRAVCEHASILECGGKRSATPLWMARTCRPYGGDRTM